MKLNTIDALFDRDLPGASPAKATTSLATVGHPGGPRD
jgi:hypothetical protein